VSLGEPAKETQSPALGSGVLAGHADAAVEAEAFLRGRLIQWDEEEFLSGEDTAQPTVFLVSVYHPNVSVHLGEGSESVGVSVQRAVLARGRVEAEPAGGVGPHVKRVHFPVQPPRRELFLGEI
jgi:hypothetical protein